MQVKGRRSIESDTCWSENLAVKKRSSSYSKQKWVTVCSTAKNDPRAENGRYEIKAQGPEKLVFKDLSRYDWKLRGSHCVATTTSIQLHTRVHETPDKSIPVDKMHGKKREKDGQIEESEPEELADLIINRWKIGTSYDSAPENTEPPTEITAPFQLESYAPVANNPSEKQDIWLLLATCLGVAALIMAWWALRNR
ncbi:MAG: hypothetical protein IPJ88_08060 [Myxococcales bacterium]|nr:MAG: hypothetical protein IPJ88_08060 [Myxococcales bacterium]